MCRSLASVTALPFAVVFLALPPQSFSQSQAHQDVTVVVRPILAIALASPAPSGSVGLMHYDMTSNVRGAILEAAISAPSGSTASLTLTSESSCGRSVGKVQLHPGAPPVPVVIDLNPGLEKGQTIAVEIEGDAPEDMTLTLTLRDPVSGMTQTAETKL